MTARGKFVFTLIFLVIVGVGVAKWWEKIKPADEATPGSTSTTEQQATPAAEAAPELKLIETQTEVPRLDAALPYVPKDNIVDIELSEYAGYAGLIVANGGLEPNDNSVFAKKHGFKVRLKLSEEESWSALNSGKMAASATTVDVLALYGRQFNVVVPVQIGFSRGADGVVVRAGLKRVNDLKGKVLSSAQFTEADFFIRYLAQEAGIEINMLPDLDAKPDPDKINLVYAEDAFAACDAFVADVNGGGNRLAGCVTWAPKTTETVDESSGKAKLLTTNRNLLIVADILIVNKGFAQAQPKMVQGLVAGLLEGNQMVRTNPDAHLGLIGKAFKWDAAQTKIELAKVHLSNGPENLAFFSGAMDAAGSFGGIYQSAIFSYGSEMVKNPVDSERFVDTSHLKGLEAAGAFTGQQISIAPIRSAAGGPVESDPLLSKNVRFLFEPNSAVLDVTNQENLKNLTALKQMLQISPGSTIVLRGHVDNSKVPIFKQQGDVILRQMAFKAIEFSRQRAAEIKKQLNEREKVDAGRIEILGVGWEEPLGTDSEQNRRVEAQWFTLE